MKKKTAAPAGPGGNHSEGRRAVNRGRKAVSVFLCLLMPLFAFSAQADPYWNMCWKPGEYTVDFASGEERITAVMEESIRLSEGTPARTDADRETPEVQYERYISFFPDGSPVVNEEILYDDIGYYRWAVGIPDDQCISRDEAWKIALGFLTEQGLAGPETLAHYYPQAAFDIGYDPENPIWKITPVCYDDEATGLPATAWEVAVYARDGSICGYREVSGAG